MSIEKELLSHKHMEDYLEIMTSRKIGHESAKTYLANVQSGFFDKYLSGKNVLDIGYQGVKGVSCTIVPYAIGIDCDTPGYDGLHLPVDTKSQDAVYSSHCLEHIEDHAAAICEWFRVLKIGGYLVLTVPHQYLYERKSIYDGNGTGHVHFYTPATLMELIESALLPNTYRIRSLRDNDMLYDYGVPLSDHPTGCYEIELVVQKIQPPMWELA